MAKSLIPENLGPQIGKGSKRTVYAHPTRPDLVVKVAKKPKAAANRREYTIWKALRDREEGRWLAKVYEVSEDYRMLVQERLEPAIVPPPDIPEWMGEISVRHWGYARDGSMKHCDYESAESRRKLKQHLNIEVR